jgi:hemerythrin-like domain-containing protein
VTQPADPSTEHGIDHLPERLHGYALMHVAMRRDARRAVTAARTLGPATARPVTAWWRRFRAIVEHHHRSEDDMFWPALAEAVPGFTSAPALADDHIDLDAALADVGDALASGGDEGARARATDAAACFDTLLREHLRREEAAVLPTLVEMPADRYEAIEDLLTRTAPVPVLSMLRPWMFDGADPAAVRRVSATAPAPARLLGRAVGQFRYDRLVAPVRRAS